MLGRILAALLLAATPALAQPANQYGPQPTAGCATTATCGQATFGHALASDGTFSVTWRTPFVNTPAVWLSIHSANSQPVDCQFTTTTTTGATGKCFSTTNPTIAILGLVTIFSSATAASGTVDVFAKVATQ